LVCLPTIYGGFSDKRKNSRGKAGFGNLWLKKFAVIMLMHKKLRCM